MRGDFLDVHAAFGTRHQANALGPAVDHHADVEFFFDVRAFFNQQATDFLSLGAGLMRLQHHAENLRSVAFHLVERTREFDAAPLATTAGVNLRLHHPDVAAEFLCCGHCLINTETRDTAGCHNAEAAQYFLSLIFVNLHGSPW